MGNGNGANAQSQRAPTIYLRVSAQPTRASAIQPCLRALSRMTWACLTTGVKGTENPNQPPTKMVPLTPVVTSGRSYGRGHDPPLLETWPSAEDNVFSRRSGENPNQTEHLASNHRDGDGIPTPTRRDHPAES